MKLLGAALVTAAGLLAGLSASAGMRARAEEREALCRMLALLEWELGRFATPLPALFARLESRTEGPARDLCRRVSEGLERLGQEPLEDIWARAVQYLPPAERAILLPLGQVLGRYGAAEQAAAAAACRGDMERARDQAADALRERGRMAVGVSAAGAAALAVLLL